MDSQRGENPYLRLFLSPGQQWAQSRAQQDFVRFFFQCYTLNNLWDSLWKEKLESVC